jgi:hypothetical protein
MLQSSTSFPSLETADVEKRKMLGALGARALEDSAGGVETATSVSLRYAGERATLSTIAAALDAGFTRLLQWHAWWALGAGDQMPEAMADVSWTTNRQFYDTRMTPSEFTTWITALQSDAVSFETFYAALTRGDLARPGVKAEEELKAIADRAQATPEMPNVVVPGKGTMPPPVAPPEEDEEDEEDEAPKKGKKGTPPPQPKKDDPLDGQEFQ